MLRLIILVNCIFLCSCKGDKGSGKEVPPETSYTNDSLKLFSAIERDSTYFISYQFSKLVAESGLIRYIYNSNAAKSFIIDCDTTTKIFKLITDGGGTTPLYHEQDRFYIVNGKLYEVLKLVANKGVTDGEVSYFVSTDFGLLLNKSNTWRMCKILNPETGNERLQLIALLYRVLTDADFLKNQQPESKIKFTPPKVE